MQLDSIRDFLRESCHRVDPRIYGIVVPVIVQLVVAPLERMKILMQTAPLGAETRWGSTLNGIYAERGLPGVYAGTLTGIGRYIVGVVVKELLARHEHHRFLECVTTGLVCHPFDLRHTFRAAEHDDSVHTPYPSSLIICDPETTVISVSLITCSAWLRAVFSEFFVGQIGTMYPGAVITLAETDQTMEERISCVITALSRFLMDSESDVATDSSSPPVSVPRVLPMFLSVLCASVLLHPLDTVYRMLLAQHSLKPGATSFSSSFACAKQIYATEGLSGFFRGLLPSMLKVMITSAVVCVLA